MGSSASKAAQATTKSRPPWAGATAESLAAAARARPNFATGRPSEVKDDFILRDSQDPELLRQLGQIGQVAVDAKALPFRAAESAQMASVIRSRLVPQESQDASIRNKLPADLLSDALNELKSASSQTDIQKIAKDFNMDMDLLQRLALIINAPSVHSLNEGNSGKTSMKAFWTDSPIRR